MRKHFFSKPRYHNFVSHLTIWSSLTYFLHAQHIFAQGTASGSAETTNTAEELTFTVNFNNTSVIEVIRFVSKTTGINFIFSEEDLQFNVTIISEEPTSTKNITSALIQILRIQGLKVLEQEGNIVITSSSSLVNQLPTIVGDNVSISTKPSPIITRIFRIQNAQLADLVRIIQPMTSPTSIIEVFESSRQLIITDITTNVDKIGTLIQSLDIPYSNLEIETYTAKHVSVAELVSLVTQILAPFADNNPLLFVPQQEAHAIFLVSTPYLLELAMSVLEDIDNPLRAGSTQFQMHLYTTKGATTNDVLAALQHIAEQTPDSSQAVLQAIQKAKAIPGTSSLLFFTDSQAWSTLSDLLAQVDQDLSSQTQAQAYLYKCLSSAPDALLSSIARIAEQMPNTDVPLYDAIVSGKVIPGTSSIFFYTDLNTWNNLQGLLLNMDEAPPQTPVADLDIYTYVAQTKSPTMLLKALQETVNQLPSSSTSSLQDAISNAKSISSSSSLIFFTDPATWAIIQDLLSKIDGGPSALSQKAHLYKALAQSAQSLLNSLQTLTQDSSEEGSSLLSAISSAKVLSSSSSILFFTDNNTWGLLQTMLKELDVTSQEIIWSYQMKGVDTRNVSSILSQLADALQSPSLKQVVQSATWVPDSQSFVFVGMQADISKIQSVLPLLDGSSNNVQFFLYTIQTASESQLSTALGQMASTLQDKNLVKTIESMNAIEGTNLLLFHGTAASISKLQNILSSLDTASPSEPAIPHFLLYTPLHQSSDNLQSSVQELEKNLESSGLQNLPLLTALQSMKWVESSHSLVFTGDKASLDRIQAILANFDVPAPTSGISLYKLQYVKGNDILSRLQALLIHLPQGDTKSASIATAIQNTKWVQDTNTLVLSGPPYGVEQVKALIMEFDSAPITSLNPKSDFFFYKPTNVPLEDLETVLSGLADDLSSSGLADPDFIHTLRTVHAVSASGSLLFTGTAASLAKVKALLPTVDLPIGDNGSLETVGATTFFIYKAKNATISSLVDSLKNFSGQLSSSNASDLELGTCLNSVKVIADTNSLYFHGTTDVLERVRKIVEQLDTSLTPQRSDIFAIYVPQARTGPELITLLSDFTQNLSSSGVSDPGLFDAVQHLRYVQKTNSLIISGDPASISKVQDLLTKFDIPGLEGGASITAIEATNFLIYKLQYHQGIDIQVALKKVASSLARSSPDANKVLIDAVDSLQWIEVTNSLIGTGDPDVLAKIKELILGLDIPLRQVFIEVLVVETSLFNSQTFGLQWGSQLQYLNKTVGAMGNFPSVVNPLSGSTNNSPGALDLSNPISFTTNTNTPVQGNALSNNSTAVPFSTGFDLGVIGDIIFHKGQSFISLGSLLNALQVDNDTTIMMNPKIITQDGHTSRIFVGQNIPFVGSFISNTASNTLQSSNIEYRDVGVNLVITPTLGTNNIITLDIQQDISEQINNSQQVQPMQVTGIQTSHTIMNTRVHVPDRHFLVLSGMIQDSKMHFKTGIPCLGGLPVIGALFSENDRIDTKNNIIIFLRPFIIDTFEEYDRLTEAEEELYKEEAGLQDLKEQFDASTETIKGLNNE